jgi:hypothetical protein
MNSVDDVSFLKLIKSHVAKCECCRNDLKNKNKEVGHHPTPAEAQTANPDFAANEKRKTYLNG